MGSFDFDRQHGTDTDGEIPVELLDHGPEIAGQAVSYEPTDPDAFKAMLAGLPIERSDYTFIDLGSGKGRAVLLAALHGFGTAIGIEASLSLHQTACRNRRIWARCGRETRAIQLACGDAANAEIPAGPCVAYLFNPFRERVLRAVARNVRNSLATAPRDLWLIYYNPQFDDLLETSRCLARVTVGRGFQQGDYSIWRSHGAYRGSVQQHVVDG